MLTKPFSKQEDATGTRQAAKKRALEHHQKVIEAKKPPKA
jgi:hypothetical protein